VEQQQQHRQLLQCQALLLLLLLRGLGDGLQQYGGEECP
jgi:hypothetical protein